MFEVRVTGHPELEASEETWKVISIIRLFRSVTGLGLKDSKDHTEAMLGREWYYPDEKDRPAGSLLYERQVREVERKPYTVACKKRVHAQLLRIQFSNDGFSAEVHKRGQR